MNQEEITLRAGLPRTSVVLTENENLANSTRAHHVGLAAGLRQKVDGVAIGGFMAHGSWLMAHRSSLIALRGEHFCERAVVAEPIGA